MYKQPKIIFNVLFFRLQTAGKCPAAPAKPECPDPVSICSIDDECTGNQKCCDDGCGGTECRAPSKHKFITSILVLLLFFY